MKTKNYILILTAVISSAMALTASRCSKEQEPEPEPVNTTITTTNFDYQNFGCDIANMQHDTVYMINSNEEFANYFSCETDPQIDFATKTLLIARGSTTNGIHNISTELSVNNRVYSLSVDVTLNITAVAQGWHISLIADKINTNYVQLNFNQHF